ncbi:MAG: PKD domain-containing protein [Bacteroidota bacterium]
MKQTLRFLFIAFGLLLQAQLFANTVIVKGTVKDSANHAIANKTVRIYTTDSTQGCLLSHTVTTNPNGYYIDTLTCNGNISKLIIVVENCNGTKITHDPAVGPNTTVESNFIICTTISNPVPVTCKAYFTSTVSSAGVKFNSSGSSTIAGDTIISRTWIFGDSSAQLSGNQVDPSHTYTKSGTYNVCLTIKTKRGCESNYCQPVVYTAPSNDCRIESVITVEKLAPGKYRFNNSQTTIAAGDSIFQRIWKFSDGTSLDGNQVNPLKEFKDTGTYYACVTIKTKRGCEKQFCLTLTIHDTVPGTTPVPTNCKAQFSTSIQTLTVKFNSANSSSTGAGDSIISRTWIFGDNSAQLTGNHVDPSHVYAKAGSYTACLYIKTQKGCESKYCFDFTLRDSVPPTPTNCKAQFSTSIQALTVKFNSANSSSTGAGDSIISRTWIFGDNSAQLTGNRVDPSHVYAKAGSYTACLYIKTQKGCESKYCFDFTLRDSVAPPPTNCKATFTYTIRDSVITFNSSASTGTSPDDSIISRTWYYIDSSTNVSLGGNVVSPSYPYSQIKPGIYSVTLVIKTKKGCESKYVGKITIPPPPVPTNCKAVFTVTVKDSTVSFNSAASVGTSADDSIISRTWYFGDNSGSVSLSGNVTAPSHTYAKPGTYTTYLVIKTKKGCESKFSETVTIVPPPPPTGCKAVFTYSMQNGTVKFNSTGSHGAGERDSIISRTWLFGDSSAAIQGNVDPYHNYTKAGKYTVVFYIKTKNGCESKYSETITITLAPPFVCNVEAQFTAERISLKKVQFNSSLSRSQAGDSIIQRNWKFGDNTVLSGNEIKPVKEYPMAGIYTACLEVKTVHGCAAVTCKQVTVQDTVTTPQASVDYLKIISINPNPVVTRMVATIFSRNSNVEAEISIYDIYGVRKMTIKKLLLQGNNIIEINTGNLYHGPYFLRVTSRSGNDARAFYKL